MAKTEEIEQLKYNASLLTSERDYFRNLYEAERLEKERLAKMLERETPGNEGLDNEKKEIFTNKTADDLREFKAAMNNEKAKVYQQAERVEKAERQWKQTFAKLEVALKSLRTIKPRVPHPSRFGNYCLRLPYFLD